MNNKVLVCLTLMGTLLMAGCSSTAPEETVDGYLYLPTEESGNAGPAAIVAGTVTLTGNCWTLQTEETDYPLFLAAPKGSVTIKNSNDVLALKIPNGLVLEEGSALDDGGGYLSIQTGTSPDLAALVESCPNVPGSQYEENTWEIAAPALRR